MTEIFSFFLHHFLGAPGSEWLLLPKQAAALSEGTQWCKGGTGSIYESGATFKIVLTQTNLLVLTAAGRRLRRI
jgi:hypothetical protein